MQPLQALPYLWLDVFRELAGVTCVALPLTWIRSRPFKWPLIIGIKLTVWGLRLLKWLIKKRTIQYLVFRPFAFGTLAWIIWKVITDPDRLNASGNPQVAELLVQIKATINKRAEYPTNDVERDRGIAFSQSMTWGVAGAALILLTTILVATHPTDKAALIATACFAFAIPTLVMCGFIQLSHAHSNPSDTGIQPPTLREALKVISRTHIAYFFVCIGVAAMLWSYDWNVSIAFIVSLYLPLRLYRRTVKVGTAKQPPATETVALPPQLGQSEGDKGKAA